jgi:hypothetical protein
LFKTLPHLLITHVHRAPVLSPSHVPCKGKEVLKSDKKKNQPSSFRDATFFTCRLPKVSRVRRKEEKSIEVSKSRNANRGLRSSLFLILTNPKENKQGRCAEAQGLVVVGSKSPKSRRAKRIPFSFGSPPKAKPQL